MTEKIQHNLLCKAWIDMRPLHILNVIYITYCKQPSFPDSTKHTSSRHRGRLMTTEVAMVWQHIEIWLWVPKGARCQDWPTNSHLQSDSDLVYPVSVFYPLWMPSWTVCTGFVPIVHR